MFILYWILMILALVTSFIYIVHAWIKKDHFLVGTSLVQCGLACFLMLMNIISSKNSVFSFDENIQELILECFKGNIGAIGIVVCYVLLFYLVITNGNWVTERKQHPNFKA